jgi:hypothetical protein
MFSNQFKFSSVIKHPGYNDPVSAAVSIGSSLLGSAISSGAASDAAQMQTDAARAGQAQQQAMFDKQNAQLAPQRAVGYNAINNINSFLGGQYQTYDAQGNPVVDKDGKPVMQTGQDYFTHQFNNADLNSNLAPNYQFQLGQGQQALNAQNNATGGLVGGNSLKSMQDYTQNFAGNAYQNAFTNYNSQRQNIYNTLAGIAGLGQNASNTTATLAGNTANSISNLGVGAANAAAAGTVGSANAISGGLGNAANMYSLSNILNPSISNAGGINMYSNSVPSYFGNGSGAPASYNQPSYVA